jgi:hypothetical protein
MKKKKFEVRGTYTQWGSVVGIIEARTPYEAAEIVSKMQMDDDRVECIPQDGDFEVTVDHEIK